MPTQNPGCLAGLLRLLGLQSADRIVDESLPGEERFPYRLRDDFLSPAELSFYHVLSQAISGQMAICPKVSLADIFLHQPAQ